VLLNLKRWTTALALVGTLFAVEPADPAQYVVDGFVLGSPVTTGSPNYQTYQCQLSDEFADSTFCRRTQEKSGRLGKITVSSSLIHGSDGSSLYLMTNASPVSLNKSALVAEIDDLSRAIGDHPSATIWLDQNNASLNGVIAAWGQIKFEEIKGDDLDALASGNNPQLGVLVDYVGNPRISAKNYLPIYRIVGGEGYVYSASFDASGRGNRHYVAANAAQLAVRQYRRSLQRTLELDKSLPSNDYQLWPKVATATRQLARDTSPKIANDTLDLVFRSSRPTKLRSHVWAFLPLGAIQRLAGDQFSRLDIYAEKTEHPDIRRDIMNFISNEPSDPFIEFAYFILGNFDKALRSNPKSPIRNVLNYAFAYTVIQTVLNKSLPIASAHVSNRTNPYVKEELKNLIGESPDTIYHVSHALGFVNHHPELFENKQLGVLLPNFSSEVASAEQHLDAVARDQNSAIADDAAYMLGWLTLAEAKRNDALAYFTKAITVGNADYKRPALRQIVKILEELPPNEQLSQVEGSPRYAAEIPLLYMTARSAFREFDYTLAADAAQKALRKINIPIEQLPVTTDPARIGAVIEKLDPKLSFDPNVTELPYLLQASREISQYQNFLTSNAVNNPNAFSKAARAIIIKFSMLIDQPNDKPKIVAHKDLRQALHIIDLTMQRTSENAQYKPLREWIYYRRIRILSLYAPEQVAQEIAIFEHEFPASKLLDDASAELVFAQGITMKDPDSAARTANELLRRFPNGNALDNAFSWVAISTRCAGRLDDAKHWSEEIIRRFPLTRHAKYARERLADADRYIDIKDCGW